MEHSTCYKRSRQPKYWNIRSQTFVWSFESRCLSMACNHQWHSETALGSLHHDFTFSWYPFVKLGRRAILLHSRQYSLQLHLRSSIYEQLTRLAAPWLLRCRLSTVLQLSS